MSPCSLSSVKTNHKRPGEEGQVHGNSWWDSAQRAEVDGGNNKLGIMRLPETLLWAAFLVQKVVAEYGMAHFSDKDKSKGKDYCIFFNSQWARLPQDLNKASRLQIYDLTSSVLCSASEVPEGGFPNRIPMVLRGNCTFYEKVRLAQINGAKGLLIVSKDRLTPPAGNKSQYEEIDIPVALLSYADMLDISRVGQLVAMYAPNEPVLDYNMVIIFLMAVGTVAIGGYWAGSRDNKKRYMKHKRDDSAEKQAEDMVDVTPIMICVFVVMCCSMLVLLYFYYDYLAFWVIAIFCLASSVGLYSCLWPFIRRLPFCKCRIPENNLPYLHKRPQVRMLLLSAFCVAVSITWMVFRNEDQWAWVLQDALGITFCLYMLKTVRLSTFKCTFKPSGESIMVEVAAGPSDSFTHEKLPMVLKVPRLNSSPLALCDRPFSLLGFGDILVPGLLVAYCHRFDILMQTSRIYFVACTIAYGVGLLITFVALALMQMGQPALLYLVPCTLLTSLTVALFRRELPQFWTGNGFVVNTNSGAHGRTPVPHTESPKPRSRPGPGLKHVPRPKRGAPGVQRRPQIRLKNTNLFLLIIILNILLSVNGHLLVIGAKGIMKEDFCF
uniref:Signal peptide peptidase-like 2B n=1 Tax=Periophthalmus magnuspinnatus TaxID=409849 RepID=A0A3B4ANG9_9GOBI